MVPDELKRQFGDQLSFHGGLDVQKALPQGSPEEVRRTVRELISVLGRDGGYILCPSHNVQVDTPPLNIVSVYEEAGALGRR